MVRIRDCCVCCGHGLPARPRVGGRLTAFDSSEHLHDAWMGFGADRFFDYYRCSVCGTLNVRAYPDEHLISQFYASMPPNMAGALTLRQQQANQRAYASLVSRAVVAASDPPLRILELGADCGWLLAQLVHHLPGRVASIAAVEPNLAVADHLDSTLATLPVPCRRFEAFGQAVAAQGEPIDLVVAIHVLDHLFAIAETMDAIRSVLSPRGRIFVVVHNPQSLLAGVLGRRWPPYSHQHPQLFSPRGMAMLARRHGLRLLASGATMNQFSLGLALSHLGLPPTPLDRLPLRAPLGNRYYLLGMPGYDAAS